jgi:hypothetical protein
MIRSQSKPEMTSTSIRASTSISTTTTMNTMSTSAAENTIIIKTKGLPSTCFNYLYNRVLPASRQNALTICDYIHSLKSESNPYRRDNIILLCKVSTFFKNTKLFKEITREDLLSFLDSFRKIESADPLHQWIGTYNTYRINFMRFFKWLYYPDIEQKTKTMYYRKYSTAKAKRKINLQANRFMDCTGRFAIFKILS